MFDRLRELRDNKDYCLRIYENFFQNETETQNIDKSYNDYLKANELYERELSEVRKTLREYKLKFYLITNENV